MNPLAIIPARAGSKRLPNKNRQMIGEWELWAYAAAVAQASRVFGPRVWLTTDYEDLVVPLTQPEALDPMHYAFRGEELCRDDTPMMAVVEDVVKRARVYVAAEEFDAVVLLQPTSPLRTANDIRRAVELLEGADAVISVVETPAPEIFTIGHAGRLRPISLSEQVDGRKLAAPNGAIFAITTAALDRGLDWWTADVVRAYVMPPERSVDIDTIVDLEKARELWAPGLTPSN